MQTERPVQHDDDDHIGHIIERTLPVKPTPPPEHKGEQQEPQPKGWPFPDAPRNP